MDKERRDHLRDRTAHNVNGTNCVPINRGELRALLDMADERDELEKAVDPRGRRPPGMSIVQLAEWKTYLASVRDRVLTLVSPHSRDEDADADDTVERIVKERDGYRALLEEAAGIFRDMDEPETAEWINAALEGKHG